MLPIFAIAAEPIVKELSDTFGRYNALRQGEVNPRPHPALFNELNTLHPELVGKGALRHVQGIQAQHDSGFTASNLTARPTLFASSTAQAGSNYSSSGSTFSRPGVKGSIFNPKLTP